MQKQKLTLIISLGISIIVAAIVLMIINNYINQNKEQVKDQAEKAIVNYQANQASVLVAKRDIPRGTAITAEMLENAIVPRQFVQPQAVTSLDRIAGMTTIAAISTGEQVTLTKLIFAPQAEGRGGLASVTPIGKRAITISVDEISSVAGLITPGDYVDVIANMPIPVKTAEGKEATQEAVVSVLQNILVLAIGQNIGIPPRQSDKQTKTESKPQSSPLITLALDSKEAGLLAFLQEQSKIRLVLRSLADSKIGPVQITSWDTLFQYIMPRLEPEPQSEQAKLPESEKKAKGKTPPSQEYVEVYRGLIKDKIPLSAER